MLVDLPLARLREYESSQTEPDDFDEFWSATLAGARAVPVELEATRLDLPFSTIDVFDVSFRGWAGERVRGWLRLPRSSDGPLPAVVQYVGYSGGRGAPVDELFWASSGYAHLVMDTRGQGGSPMAEGTGDSGIPGATVGGVMTRGIEHRDDYYFRRVFTDAVRAVDAVRTHPAVDPRRVSVLGTSQGGGIALAVAGLVPELQAVSASVPFLCDFPRAIRVTDSDPYREIGRYLAAHRGATAAVTRTLAYFDAVNFSRRASAPALFSTALMDSTCPPSTVFGAYNAYSGPKDITVWEFNGHEGGGPLDLLASWRHVDRAGRAPR
ncbi:acetylxylan esterase [Herbiconiux sp. VKM Ac-1786]|uniref:acetylxylan esterase n=1 Tax=Herbiconiux sp. VKM Ac-1786 TaxID=2783824 RepID=UPI00188D6518|nr:acetylxylan esterase [Herbiconiux sp. VKM Ac-1786]MBF4571555.1 acetylxylan esterase [Herbiconiux sp. VKM Ac-1786]